MTEVLEASHIDFPETVVFDSQSIVRVECYSNEYAAELIQEMKSQGMQIINNGNPRLAIGIRES